MAILIADLALQKVRSRISIGGRFVNSVVAKVSNARTPSEPTTISASTSGKIEPESAR
jgi:hypothetical protein